MSMIGDKLKLGLWPDILVISVFCLGSVALWVLAGNIFGWNFTLWLTALGISYWFATLIW